MRVIASRLPLTRARIFFVEANEFVIHKVRDFLLYGFDTDTALAGTAG